MASNQLSCKSDWSCNTTDGSVGVHAGGAHLEFQSGVASPQYWMEAESTGSATNMGRLDRHCAFRWRGHAERP